MHMPCHIPCQIQDWREVPSPANDKQNGDANTSNIMLLPIQSKRTPTLISIGKVLAFQPSTFRKHAKQGNRVAWVDSAIRTCAAVGLYGIDRGLTVCPMGIAKRTLIAFAAIGKSVAETQREDGGIRVRSSVRLQWQTGLGKSVYLRREGMFCQRWTVETSRRLGTLCMEQKRVTR